MPSGIMCCRETTVRVRRSGSTEGDSFYFIDVIMDYGSSHYSGGI